MHQNVLEGISRESTVSHFLIIAYRHEFCGWVSILPDFVGVTGRASEMGLALWRAAKAAQQVCDVLAQLDQPLPTPTDLASARKRHVWINAYGLDWSTAVVRSVRLSDTPQATAHQRAAHQASKSAIIPMKQGSRSNRNIDSPAQADVR
jgi:hypothetical protein